MLQEQKTKKTRKTRKMRREEAVDRYDRAQMSRATPPLEKIVELPVLVDLLAGRRADGERIVLTNGCFELLHRGHVRYLAAAAKLADLLVVGLNSDASVRALKGPGRPLVPEHERAEVLAALGCVDFVLIFDAPTAEGLVEALKPEVYAKGGDYADRSPPEAVLVQRLGGEFRVLELVHDSSTTALVRRIQGRS
jgi:rfaE bifunctional protein nucleotidyltransferase chain/domain